jgi:hypothetical protein
LFKIPGVAPSDRPRLSEPLCTGDKRGHSATLFLNRVGREEPSDMRDREGGRRETGDWEPGRLGGVKDRSSTTGTAMSTIHCGRFVPNRESSQKTEGRAWWLTPVIPAT